jgi:hypothetical protein
MTIVPHKQLDHALLTQKKASEISLLSCRRFLIMAELSLDSMIRDGSKRKSPWIAHDMASDCIMDSGSVDITTDQGSKETGLRVSQPWYIAMIMPSSVHVNAIDACHCDAFATRPESHQMQCHLLVQVPSFLYQVFLHLPS